MTNCRELVISLPLSIAFLVMGAECGARQCATCPTPCPPVSGDLDLHLPWRSGEEYPVTQGYWTPCGEPTDHAGYPVDFRMPEGTPVVATATGTVYSVEVHELNCPGGCPNASDNFGTRVVMRHTGLSGTSWYSVYAHLSQPLVTAGPTTIPQGTVIGLSGNTGWSTAAHLHFQIRRDSPFPPGGQGARPTPMAQDGVNDFALCETYRRQGPPIFTLGQSVQVFGLPTGSLMSVYSDQCAQLQGSVSSGTTGSVIGGPVRCSGVFSSATCGPISLQMWKVQWPSGVVGWSAQNWLRSSTTGSVLPSITNLGTLPGGTESYANGVSGDGAVVVGHSTNASGIRRAFRWTGVTGMQDLGTLWVNGPFGPYSFANAVNIDGTIVAGQSAYDSNGERAFRWSSAGGMQNLGTLFGAAYSNAHDMNGDGSVIVGRSGYRAFRWSSAGGMQSLGLLPGGSQSYANGVSSNGAVVVGYGDATGAWRAFRWTSASGMQSLGAFPGGGDTSAYGVSGNGLVVVGTAYDVNSGFPTTFRWTSTTGMQDLGMLPSNDSYTYGVNDTGTAIVLGNGRGYLWTEALGAVDLNAYLPTIGVNLSGWFLVDAKGISANGSVIVGTGTFGGAMRAWRVTGVPIPVQIGPALPRPH